MSSSAPAIAIFAPTTMAMITSHAFKMPSKLVERPRLFITLSPLMHSLLFAWVLDGTTHVCRVHINVGMRWSGGQYDNLRVGSPGQNLATIWCDDDVLLMQHRATV